MTLSLALAGIGLAFTAAVAMREHARVTAARRTLLDRCAPLLSKPVITNGGDGFPTLEGFRDGRFIRIELLPDTMTIRRLPQLWLKITQLEARPAHSEFSLLVRPSGTEFYSLTGHHSVTLEPPAGVTTEIIAKGDRADSQYALDASSPALRRIFSDPRAKEAAVTRKGLRLIWQAAEGHRGEHLLFRQCRFENASVDPSALVCLLSHLDELGSSLDEQGKMKAA